MERKPQNGYLVLADISGYTLFLTQAELDHAEIALSLLLEAIVGQLNGSLTIAKLEGDAVFAYSGESGLPGGKALLEVIDGTYLAFRNEADELILRSTCPCKACRAIPTLDLKFMVHHGEFIVQEVAGIKDLLGTDVNLVHRLMKNHVVQSVGWRGYALFTSQGLEQARPDRAPFVQQTEFYEHLGEVDTYVLDMHLRYDAMKSA